MSKKLKTPYREPENFLPPLSWAFVFKSKWAIPVILTFLIGVILSLRTISDIDLGFHLHGGKYISENLKFPEKDTYTYTVNQNDYIDLHWGYQLILYGTYLIGSYEGISILNSLFILTVIVLLFRLFLQSGIPVGYSVWMLTASVFAMEIRFGVRPEILSWILLLSTVFILDNYFHKQNNRLFLLPILMVIWVNVQGLFIIGLIVIGAYFLSSLFHTKMIDKNLIKWGLISSASVFINPYFSKGVLFPFYLFTRLQSGSVFHDAISEFLSPWILGSIPQNPFFPTIPVYLFYLFSILGSLLILFSIRKRKLHEVLLFASFLYIASASMRNLPLFILIAAPILLKSIYQIVQKFELSKYLGWIKNISFPLFTSAFLILISLRIMTDFYYMADRGAVHFGIGLQTEKHPVSTVEFLKSNHLTGRILNDLNTGSWLGWDLSQPVFIDGRLEVMQEEFFGLYRESLRKNGLNKLISIYKPDLVVFDPVTNLQWSFDLEKSKAWRLIHLDELSVVYAKNGYAENLPEFSGETTVNELIKKAGVDFSDQLINESSVPIPKMSPFEFWISGFFRHTHYHPYLQNAGIYFYQHGQFGLAEKLYLAFLLQTGGNMKEIYFNMGSLYYRWNQPEKMKTCYRIYLTFKDDKVARQRIGN